MPPNTCPITGEPLPDGYAIHPACAGRLTATVADLPEIMSCLDDAIGKRLRTGQSSAYTGQPCPVNLGILDKAHTERQRLLIAMDYLKQALNLPDQPSWVSVKTSLTLCADKVCRLTQTGPTDTEGNQWPTLGEYIYQQINYSIAQITRLIDRAPQRQYAGPCPTCGHDTTTQRGTTTAECPVCGTTWDADEARRKMLSTLANIPCTTYIQLANALTVLGYPTKPDTLRKHYNRNQQQLPTTPTAHLANLTT